MAQAGVIADQIAEDSPASASRHISVLDVILRSTKRSAVGDKDCGSLSVIDQGEEVGPDPGKRCQWTSDFAESSNVLRGV
jgi:hypothetical protein